MRVYRGLSVVLFLRGCGNGDGRGLWVGSLLPFPNGSLCNHEYKEAQYASLWGSPNTRVIAHTHEQVWVRSRKALMKRNKLGVTFLTHRRDSTTGHRPGQEPGPHPRPLSSL